MSIEQHLREQGIPEDRIAQLASHRLGDILNDDGSSDPAFKIGKHFYRAQEAYKEIFPVPTPGEYLESRSKPQASLPVSAPPETPEHLLSPEDYIRRREARKSESGPSIEAYIADRLRNRPTKDARDWQK